MIQRRAGRGLESAERALDTVGRALEPAGKALEPAERASEPAGRVLEPAGRPGASWEGQLRGQGGAAAQKIGKKKMAQGQ